MSEHWAVSLIGRSYATRGRGPEAYDCWGLCCHVWREHFGLSSVPDVQVQIGEPKATRRRFADAVSAGEAREIDAPVEGCAVYMSRARLPDHIGIYANGGVLHAMERTGVVFTRINALPFLGLKVLGFYLPQGFQWPTSTSSTI